MAGRYSVEGVFRVVDRMTRPIQRINSRLERMANGTIRGFREMAGAFSFFRTGFLAGGAAIAAAAGAMATALHDVIETGMEFDRVMAMTGARFGVRQTSEEFAALQQAAIDASRTSGFTANQVAEALGELGASGASATDAIAQLPSILATAAAAGIDLQAASDLTTDTLTAFGLSTSDAAQQTQNLARVSDVMAAGANSTSMSFDQLVAALGNVSATAHSAGVDIETTTALIGQLAEAGEKGERAGTGLAAVFANLRTPTPQAARALRRLGIQTRNADGSFRSMIDVIGNFETSLAGLNDEARDQALADIFGQQGLRSMQLLLARGSGAIRTLDTNLRDAGGSAADMAAQMQDSAAGDMARMTAEVTAMKLEIWALLRGPVRGIVRGITQWVSANQELITSGIEDSISFLTENMPTIVTWLRRIGIAAAVIAIPFVLFTATLFVLPAIFLAVVVAIVEAATWLYDNIGSIWDSIVQTISDAWDSIVAFLMPGIEFVVGLFALLADHVRGRVLPWIDLFRLVAGFFMSVWARVQPYFAGLWQSITTLLSDAMAMLAGPMESAVDTVKSIWGGLTDFFAGLWQGIADAFMTIVGPGLALAGEIIDRITGAAGGAVGDVRARGREAMGTEGSAASRARVVSPQERTARSISETTRTERAEVTIRDQTGRASTTRPRERRGSRIQLQPSGGVL